MYIGNESAVLAIAESVLSLFTLAAKEQIMLEAVWELIKFVAQPTWRLIKFVERTAWWLLCYPYNLCLWEWGYTYPPMPNTNPSHPDYKRLHGEQAAAPVVAVGIAHLAPDTTPDRDEPDDADFGDYADADTHLATADLRPSSSSADAISITKCPPLVPRTPQFT
jgi:hypothetical protein